MKSAEPLDNVTFTRLYNRLIMEVLFRINRGDITERGLARIVGVSQPQIHNVLKGKRRLQTDLADRLLEKFNLSLFDLLQIEQFLVLSGGLEKQSVSRPPANGNELPSRKGPGRERSVYQELGRTAV